MTKEIFRTAGLVLAGAVWIIGCRGDAQGPGARGPVTIEGHVLRVTNSAPVAGATLGTSLDTVTTVTDAAGHFRLVTATAANYCCTPYTIYISAAGYQSFAGTWKWGDWPVDMVFQLTPGFFVLRRPPAGE